MASLQKLTILVTLISSVLCFFSSQSINANTDFLTQACKSTTEEQLCTDILKNDKQITAAATKELDLGLAIMKKIIPLTKTTHDYTLKKKAENPAYASCEQEWLDMVSGFERILEHTTKNKGFIEDTDDYDFHNVGEAAGRCKTSLEQNKIVDPEINKAGNTVMTLIAAGTQPLSHLKLISEGKIK
ncbi:uncharacterized protein LOC132040506 [Lycium ferocissimum]|uniref:uncharacterized protein LOC132040506 n=1 Tax=Lycium ferocissimum TaxID=112874 RepID=UPI0028167CEA|nr:uncharacterized protein LOC132040506 [Lycium ferocissimum]